MQYPRRFDGSAGVGAALPRRSLLNQHQQSTTDRRFLPRPEGRGFRAGEALMTSEIAKLILAVWLIGGLVVIGVVIIPALIAFWRSDA